MKLRVSLSLRHCLLMAMVATTITVGTHGAYGGIMHSDVTMQTYTDFGQNKGYYAVGGKVNALLDKLRQDDKGIIITYTDGQDPRNVASYEQGMINFTGTHDQGHSTALGPNFLATVEHNGSLAGSFNERNLGDSCAINYDAIDIRNSKVANGNTYVFRLTPFVYDDKQQRQIYDYMLQRQSKIITDVTSNSLYSGVTANSTFKEESTAISGLIGDMLYHSGAGAMRMYDEASGSLDSLMGPYNYITGSVDQITDAFVHTWSETAGTNTNSVIVNADRSSGKVIGGADTTDPLPFGCRGGDSGSPTFVWNKTTKQYEYIAAIQSSVDAEYNPAGSWSQARGAVSWTHKTLSQFDKEVDMSTQGSTVYLNAINTAGDTYTDAAGNTATVYSGNATDAAGNTIVSYNGIQTGNYTWKSLLGLKDTDNWYANSGYLNQNAATLFHNSNLVFESASGSTNTIILKDTVDLGVGYAEFSGGSYTIKSEGTESEVTEGNLFNHAGYVINEGAEVHLKLTNPADYMFEWRKIGEGALHIDGTGDTNALLNVGGTGTTYLNQTKGYAAYNVLANSGATVQITGGVNQIKRDFTFGAGGGKLDMYGNSMEWNNSMKRNNSNDASVDGFTIHALTEEAIITNTTGTTTLTVTDAATSVDDSNTFLGSFQDTASGALKVKYDGGDGSTWTLHSIHTDLSNNAASGFEVDSGAVVLSGTITEHAMGSESGTNTNRLVNENDWHYADATMNVTVNGAENDAVNGAVNGAENGAENGGTFELGSHARLTGNVTVNGNGTFVMHQGVNHRYEHMEGSANAKDTNEYAGYYGLKGNVTLNGADSTMKVQLGAEGEDVDSTTTYAGSISGEGSLIVDASTKEATLHLSGDNSGHTGTKTLAGGTLTAANMDALGDVSTNKWKVEAGATFVMSKGLDFSAIDDTATGGVIALALKEAEVQTTQLGVNSVIGAYKGYTVQYGEAYQSLEATEDGKWHLGGGGGTLVVNFLLAGNNKLVLGDGTSTGVVKLTNTGNTFSGGIVLTDCVDLIYEDADVLGKGEIDLAYRSRLNNQGDLNRVTTTSSGTFYVDDIAAKNIDLSTRPELSLGVAKDTTITGNIKVATGADYRFGGGTGVLTIDTVLSGEHGLEIDAHTHADNKVVLAQATSITGNVTVMGYDKEQSNGVTTGDMTLRLDASGALDSAASVALKNNGHIDINGTTQSFAGISMDATSSIIDSSESFSGNLTLEGLTESTTLNGEVSVGNLTLDVVGGNTFETGIKLTTNTLTKTGEGTYNLGSAVSWNKLVVENGDIWGGAGQTVAAGKMVELKGEGHLNYGGWTQFDADVTMADTSKLTIGRYQLNGDVTVKEGADVTLHKSDGRNDTNVNVYGSVDVAADAKLTLTTAHADTGFKLWNKENNASGGTINVAGKQLYLGIGTANTTQNVGGTIAFTAENVTANLTSDVSVAGATHKLGTLHVANAGTTVIMNSASDTAVTWDIETLSGDGNVKLNSAEGSKTVIRHGASVAGITTDSSYTQQLKLQSNSSSSVDVSSNISGNIAMEIASDAKLSVANAYTGGTTVTGGTLTTANDSALGTGGLVLNNNGLALEGSNLTVQGAMTSEGGSVDMGRNTLKLTADGNSLADTSLSNGTVSVGSGASLSLSGTITMSGASFVVDGTVKVDNDNGTIFALSLDDFKNKSLTLSTVGDSGSGSFAALSAANFTVNDIAASQYDLSVTQNGASIILTYSKTKDYTWSVGTGTWNTTAANWKRPENTDNETYGNDGNVTFASNDSNTEVTVAEGASAVNMTVAGDYTFKGEGVSVSHDLKVQGSGTATFDGAAPTVGGDVAVADGGTLALENVTGATVTGSVATEGTGKLSMTASSLTVNSDSVIGNVTVGEGASTLTAGGEADIRVDNLTVQNGATLRSNKLTVSGMQLTEGTIANSDAADLVMSDTISGKGSVSASTVEFVAGGAATLASGSELKLTATGKVLASGGKMTLESGAELDMTGTNIGGDGGIGNINNIFNSVQGAGTLYLQATDQDAAAVLNASADVHTNVVTDALYLNSWKTPSSVVTLYDDSSLTVNGDMYVQNTAIFHVAGGNLTVCNVTKDDAGAITAVNGGGIKLGHDTAGYPGILQMFSGSITTTSIKQANDNDTANKLIMTGGTLEFVQDAESAIAEDIQVSLVGGTLKAEQSSWHVDRALELGGLTVDVAAEKTITFNGGITNTDGTTLNVIGAGAMVLNGSVSTIHGTLNMSDESTLRLRGSSMTLSDREHTLSHIDVLGCSADGAATLSMANGATLSMTSLNLDGVATVRGDAVVTVQEASFGSNNGTYETTTTFDGVQLKIEEGASIADSNYRFKSGDNGSATQLNATVNVLNGAVVDDRASYYGVTGNLTITGDETTGGTLYINGIRLSDAASTVSSLNIGKTVHLVITGDKAMSGYTADGTGSFALSHWRAAGTVNIEGKLTSNAVISTWDSRGTINVKDGGELNLLKGLANNDDVNGVRSQTATVDVQSGARLNAAGGIHNQYLVTNLHTGATLGVIAGVSDTEVNFTNNINIGTAGATGEIVFDTDAQNVDADTYMLSKGQGVDVVLSGNNTYAGTNTIRVTGAGALHVASAKGTNGFSIAGRNGEDATLTNLTSFSRSDSTVTAAGASSSNRSVISNAMIDIAEGSTFNLSNAVVADSSYITDDAATLNVENVQLDVTVGKNATVTSESFSGAVTLQEMGGTPAQQTTVEAGTPVLAISSSLMDTVTVTGSGLTINLSGLEGYKLQNYKNGYVSLTFTNENKEAATFSSDMTVSMAYAGSNLSSPVYFRTADSSNITTLYVGVTEDFIEATVPEPTTTTLSLLALAALAARRRRK